MKNTFGPQLFPWALLRPKRAGRFARNAFLLYLLSRPLHHRTINPRRDALRRRYATRGGAPGRPGGWRVF